jgi:hypothetical protein
VSGKVGEAQLAPPTRHHWLLFSRDRDGQIISVGAGKSEALPIQRKPCRLSRCTCQPQKLHAKSVAIDNVNEM